MLQQTFILRAFLSLPEKMRNVLTQQCQRGSCLPYQLGRASQHFHSNNQNTKMVLKLNHSTRACVQGGARMQSPHTHSCSRTFPGKTLCRYLSDSRHSDDLRDHTEQSVVDEENLLALAHQVLNVTKRHDVMAASIQPQAVENLLEALCQAGCPKLPTADLLSGRLWLLQDHEVVLSIVETVMQQGFSAQVALDLLGSLPPEYCIQERPLAEIPEKVRVSTHQLRDLGFSSRNLSQLVSRSPHVLLVHTKTLRSVLARLKGLFTKADAMKVSVSCPSVFSQPWTETNKIFDYAFFKMGYTQPQLVQSGVLAFPLNKLQDRHVFLTRAGFFVQVKQKEDPRLNPNPPLSVVVKASDADFAAEFGGLTEEEYGTFLAMRELEREEEDQLEESDADSNSDTDSSDSESDNPQGKKK